jgi:hypothetical protein
MAVWKTSKIAAAHRAPEGAHVITSPPPEGGTFTIYLDQTCNSATVTVGHVEAKKSWSCSLYRESDSHTRWPLHIRVADYLWGISGVFILSPWSARNPNSAEAICASWKRDFEQVGRDLNKAAVIRHERSTWETE